MDLWSFFLDTSQAYEKQPDSNHCEVSLHQLYSSVVLSRLYVSLVPALFTNSHEEYKPCCTQEVQFIQSLPFTMLLAEHIYYCTVNLLNVQ